MIRARDAGVARSDGVVAVSSRSRHPLATDARRRARVGASGAFERGRRSITGRWVSSARLLTECHRRTVAPRHLVIRRSPLNSYEELSNVPSADPVGTHPSSSRAVGHGCGAGLRRGRLPPPPRRQSSPRRSPSSQLAAPLVSSRRMPHWPPRSPLGGQRHTKTLGVRGRCRCACRRRRRRRARGRRRPRARGCGAAGRDAGGVSAGGGCGRRSGRAGALRAARASRR